ncbi:MAG: glycosyltransferase family 2 protein, partial [Planctomycetales bacterium]|nr:glycosyltransferase family 2 protein [Planctomycetales bacterium]
MNESLTILLPVFNGQATLAARVASALESAAELCPQFEVAIVDDGSTDETEEIACDLAIRFPQVHVARHHTRRGIAACIDTGMKTTHGTIVIVERSDEAPSSAELRRLWASATGEGTEGDEMSAKGAPGSATVVARLMKWGQAVRETHARRDA